MTTVKERIQDILNETSDLSYQEGYDEGHRQGFDDALDEAVEIPDWTENFRETLERKGFDLLDSIEVRYDAALKALIFTQKGREVSFR